MTRELNMILVVDTNNAESREMISELQSIETVIPQTIVTPALVRNILPGIRATPAVGVLLWATDLQGLVADVQAFGNYLKGEEGYKTAVHAFALTASDEEVLAQDPIIYDVWAAGGTYAYNQPLIHEGRLYRVAQAGGVTAIESQPPGGDGMLAVYRPIDMEHAGTKEDPIPWVYGMDCYNEKYYSYNGKVYLCKGDMLPCVWEPGSAGVPQWEVVE